MPEVEHQITLMSKLTRKLCYRKDVRAMRLGILTDLHNPTKCTCFAARKSICTI